MPLVDSLIISEYEYKKFTELYAKKAKDPKVEIPVIYYDSHNCCEYLNGTPTGRERVLIPTNYVYSPRDYSDFYIKWLEFLNENIEYPVEYEIIDYPIYGPYCHKVATDLAKVTGKTLEYTQRESLGERRGTHTIFTGLGIYSLVYPVSHYDKIFVRGDILRKDGKSQASSLYEFANTTSKVIVVKILDVNNREEFPLRILQWTLVRDMMGTPWACDFTMTHWNKLKETFPDMSFLGIYAIIRNICGVEDDYMNLSIPNNATFNSIVKAAAVALKEYEPFYEGEDEDGEYYEEEEDYRVTVYDLTRDDFFVSTQTSYSTISKARTELFNKVKYINEPLENLNTYKFPSTLEETMFKNLNIFKEYYDKTFKHRK